MQNDCTKTKKTRRSVQVSKMKTVGYYAICTESLSSGVQKKIGNFVFAANLLGYSAVQKLIPGGGSSHLQLAKAVAFAKEDIVVVRGNSYGFFLLMTGLVVARLRGKKVILDVATPMAAVFHEIRESSNGFSNRFIKTVGWMLSGPWSFWAANRIVQYAPESSWFSIGSTKKTILVGNAVTVNAIPARKNFPNWPAQELKLIGVAQLASWHGYDLVIKAMSEFRKTKDKKYNVKFTVIGVGQELSHLKTLAKTLLLEDCVRFTGSLQGDELYKEYDDAHLAISSLGLHRIGLNYSSVLKAREYCAIGIPFLATGKDPDFCPEIAFRYEINSHENVGPIVEFFTKLQCVNQFPKPEIIRKYAEENLDFGKKVKLILEL